MNCRHCDRPAHGVCRFCGRALCKQHVKSLPHIETVCRTDQGAYMALVVADTLYCGICRPQEDPVELPDMK